ncbi:putative membrane protein [Thermosporothrix hazakensis]|jgi:drug/metabolite transporter (DMT)-like permease|uniref:EamA domain-containing protein n=2 Tax=Thermosporothrix TaxID=768650 RepID=A0A455STA9_9CHLR|nr:EamA family transporter [Thermosporothrix hazakensis]PZW24689.1 putative membrane protein [Thermosporothrix hazakensis]BBH90329.1 hypothetical protein KTC_50800 [Thermosporothrix sp. COM3]GCE48365.1 hypothetical protein KTH_32340 [Thermosporothrix hazakensis]
MAFVLALAAALGWGTADFFVRFAAGRIGSYRTLFYMQFFGLAALGLYLLVTGQLFYLLTHEAWVIWGLALGAAALNTVSSLALYRAFEVGVTMIVSPISAGYAAVTAALSLFYGEHVSSFGLFGMLAVLLGVIMVATTFGSAHAAPVRRGLLPPGVLLAILASLGYGVAFWVLGFFVTPHLGSVASTALFRLITPCLLAGYSLVGKASLRMPRGGVWWLLAAIGVFDTVAYIGFNLGVSLAGAQVSVVSVLASLYSAVTVLLAAIFVRERLQWNQWIGIGIILSGIVLVNVS